MSTSETTVASTALKKSELALFRAIFALCAVLVPLMGFLYTSNSSAYDRWVLRIFVGICAGIFLLLSYIHNNFKKNLDLAYYVYLYIIIGWVSYLFAQNHYSGNYLLAELGSFIFLGFSKFRNTKQIVAFLLYYALWLVYSLFVVTKPAIDPPVTLGLCGVFIVASYLSIQSKRSVERQLVVQEQTMSTIFNESADAIFLVDNTNQQISDCNVASMNLLNITMKKELLGKQFFGIFKEGFTQEDQKNIYTEIAKNGFFEKNQEMTSIGEKTFWANIIIKTVIIHNEKVLLVRAVDISQSKQSEFQLREQKEQLEKINQLMVGRELRIIELKKQPSEKNIPLPA